MKLLRNVAVALALLAAGAAAWLYFPNETRFRAFDPNAVGRAEAELWRAYYEHRYVDLASRLAFDGHRLFGLNRAQSLRSGLAAAKAAQLFQASRSRAEAQAALAPLTAYFRIIATATGSHIDPAEAARLELEWWQLRRETDTPEAYAPAIAAASAYLYEVDPRALADYARLRAEAMDLRDRKGAEITQADWDEIARLLELAYGDLLRAVGTTAAPAAAPAQGPS